MTRHPTPITVDIEPPVVQGGQGRRDESVEDDAFAFVVLLLISSAVVACILTSLIITGIIP